MHKEHRKHKGEHCGGDWQDRDEVLEVTAQARNAWSKAKIAQSADQASLLILAGGGREYASKMNVDCWLKEQNDASCCGKVETIADLACPPSRHHGLHHLQGSWTNLPKVEH